jgi:hypothetical protein
MKYEKSVLFAVFFVLMCATANASLYDSVYDIWNFNEPSGTIANGTLGHYGTYNGGTLGKYGLNGTTAFAIGATANYVNYTTVGLNETTYNKTFSFWYNGTSPASKILLNYFAASTGFDIQTDGSSKICTYIQNSVPTGQLNCTTAIPNDGLFHLIVAGYNQSHIYLSIDNAAYYSSTLAISGFGVPGTTQITIGKSSGSSSATGTYESFVAWNKSLTASEVSQLFALKGNTDIPAVSGNLTITAATYSGQSLSSFNISAVNSTNTINIVSNTSTLVMGINSSSYNVTISAFNQNASYQQIFTNVLGNSSLTFNYSYINVTASNILSNTPITTFNSNVTNLGSGLSLTSSTESGRQAFFVNPGLYSVYMDASGYQLLTQTIYASYGMNNANFSLFTTNSINITFLDSVSKQIITPNLITIDFISPIFSQTNTTITGKLYVDLLSPSSYTLRARAAGYMETINYLAITNRTTQAYAIYLQNASLFPVNISLPLVDTSNAPLKSALVRVQKYDVATNSYLQQASIISNDYGVIYFSGFLFSEYYRFVVEYPVGTVVYTSNPSYLTSQSLLALTIPVGYASSTGYDKASGITAAVSYNTNTQVAGYAWTDTNSVSSQNCLNVYSQAHNLINSSCSVSQSGQILLLINSSVFRYLQIDGTAKINNTVYVTSTQTYDNPSTDWGKAGIFLVFLITAVMIFFFRSDPIIAIMSVPIPVTIATMVGISGLSAWIPVVLWIICGTVAYLLRYV